MNTTQNRVFYFHSKIEEEFNKEFDLFIQNWYNLLDERVITNKVHSEDTVKYIKNALFGDVISAILNHVGRWNDYYSVSGGVVRVFTSKSVEHPNYIEIDTDVLTGIIIGVFSVPNIILGNFQHDKYLISEDWKADVKQYKESPKHSIKPKSKVITEKEEFVEKIKEILLSSKLPLSQKDLASLLGMKRTTFQSKCEKFGIKYDRSNKNIYDSKNKLL